MPQTFAITAAADQDGAIYVFALDECGQLWRLSTRGTPNARWEKIGQRLDPHGAP
jgi:hypothetical protein